MIIDRETFTELAVHLKLASDAILKTARHLAVLSNGDSGSEEHWAGTLDSLMSMNTEITVMERILRALMEANREEEGLPVSVHGTRRRHSASKIEAPVVAGTFLPFSRELGLRPDHQAAIRPASRCRT